MPDLKEGETLQIQGSASRPYTLKHVSGVYSCTCPAWRNQSLPIDRRTCKHLRSLRSDAAEQSRVGSTLPEPAQPTQVKKAPALLLAESWDGQMDPTGWLLSEKLDGVRAYWDGTRFLSRNGNVFHAPSWFTAGLPLEPLDGELWIGRKQFQKTVGIVRRQNGGELWRQVRFHVFDAPAYDDPVEARLRFVELVMQINRPLYACAHPHVVCRGHAHVQKELSQVEGLGGEGVMLRQPQSVYHLGRSGSLLKVKRFQDAEATVIGHEPGQGRHKGRLGALLVQSSQGIRFAVGTGLSDRERSNPPSVGEVITYRFQELTDQGVPRFPSFVRVRGEDSVTNRLIPQGEDIMSAASKRRLEYMQGTSSKYWEVEVQGSSVTVCYGRIGTAGQQETKTFPDPAAAHKHAEKKAQEKLRKGYREAA